MVDPAATPKATTPRSEIQGLSTNGSNESYDRDACFDVRSFRTPD